MKHFFSGVTTALITPFKNGEIDYKSVKKLIRFQLDNHIKGFVVCGSTGEAATLKYDEKRKLLQFVLDEVSSQVPVIFGSGTNNTEETVELTSQIDKTKNLKALSGFLVVTPYYNKPPQRGLVAHYKKIAKRTKKPIIVYNVPSRTGINMTAETVLQLSAVKNIVGVKEAAGNLEVVKQMTKILPKGFSILSGDDETYIPALKLGARGVISVISHVVPELCVKCKDQEKIKKISKVTFIESNPIPVKWMLKEMGLIRSAELRLPLVELDKKFHSEVKNTMKELNIL